MNIAFERIADGKIRLTTSSWDDAKVLWPNQTLEVAIIGRQVGLGRVDKRQRLVKAGYGPQA